MALAQALHHARHHSVFQRRLADQPMMRAVLADLALELEGAVALVMRLCRAFDQAPGDPAEAALARLLTPVVKYWVCKTAPGLIYEAMECLGGNGYVEDFALARLYREAPVNAIWEGSGNVMCLDVLRALAREPEPARAVLEGLAEACRTMFDAREMLNAIHQVLRGPEGEAQARRMIEQIAVLATGAALAGGAAPVAEAFARARVMQPQGRTYGTVGFEPDMAATLLGRALPV
jgi:putative acyl-CoA dehydrogenase